MSGGPLMSSGKSLQRVGSPDDRRTTVVQHAKDLDTESHDHIDNTFVALRLQRIQLTQQAGCKLKTRGEYYAN
jgi:hypothetical protein